MPWHFSECAAGKFTHSLLREVWFILGFAFKCCGALLVRTSRVSHVSVWGSGQPLKAFGRALEDPLGVLPLLFFHWRGLIPGSNESVCCRLTKLSVVYRLNGKGSYL